MSYIPAYASYHGSDKFVCIFTKNYIERKRRKLEKEGSGAIVHGYKPAVLCIKSCYLPIENPTNDDNRFLSGMDILL